MYAAGGTDVTGGLKQQGAAAESVSGPAGAGAGGDSGHGARELQVGAGCNSGDPGGEAPECGR